MNYSKQNLLIPMIFFHLLMVAQPMENENDSLSLNSSIHYGRLDNGLTYYIKNIKNPTSKIYLKLYIKAGNLDEDYNQLQLAHTLEHLAFRESKNFPEGGIESIEILKNVGMNSYDINATTTDSYTVYSFDAPVKNSIALNTGLLWFKDITGKGLKLLDSTIENERGIVRQELLGKIVNPEMFFANNKLDAVLFPGVKEIYDFDFLKTFHPQDLRRFYKEWYRTDLSAISIVGNFKDVRKIEEQLKNHFSDIKPNLNTRKPIDHNAVYQTQSPKFKVVECRADLVKNDNVPVTIHLYFRVPTSQQNTWSGIKRDVYWQLFDLVLDSRFRLSTQIYNPFYNITGNFANKTEFQMFHVTLTTEKNQEKLALERAMGLINQFRRDGVSKKEWEKVKNKQLQYLLNGGHGTRHWENGIKEHFLFGKAFVNNKKSLVSEWLSQLSLEEFNNFIKNSFPEIPEDIGVITPTGHVVGNEHEVRRWIKKAISSSPKGPYHMKETSKFLMSDKDIANLKPHEYTDLGISKFGIHEFKLDNGIKIRLRSFKPSPGVLQTSEIIMHGFSPYGAICYPTDNFFSAINTPSIVRNSGVGELNKFQLKDYLSNTNSLKSGVTPYIYYLESGIRGDTNIEDLETMFQLVYLNFTAPRKDRLAFEDWKVNELRKKNVEISFNQSEEDFRYEVKSTIGDSLFFSEITPGLGKKYDLVRSYFKGVEETNLERGYQIYQELFGNAKDFTFTFSGDFCKDSVLALARKYLGNLPNLSSITRCDQPVIAHELLKGPFYKKIIINNTKNDEFNREFYNLMFIKKLEPYNDWENQIMVNFLGILTNLHLQSLRRKGFPLYSFGANGRFNEDLLKYQISWFLKTDSKHLPIIREECKKIARHIKNGIIEESIFQEALKQLHSFYGKNRMNQNLYSSYYLHQYYRYQLPWLELAELKKYIDSITLEDITQFAMKFYSEENQFEFSTI